MADNRLRSLVRLTYLDPNTQRMLKTTFFQKIKKTARKYKEVNTQSERAELIADLKVILETYKKIRGQAG